MSIPESTDAAAREIRAAIARAYPLGAPLDEQAEFLASFAVLAPSSHNAQPWRLEIEGDTIAIDVDRTGWLVVADPDQRELYISLGCALENLLVAARAFGVGVRVEMLPDDRPECAARVRLLGALGESDPSAASLLTSIARRRTSHEPFDGSPVAPQLVERLAAQAEELGVRLLVVTEPSLLARIDAEVITADAALFSDPAYREELAEWIGRGVFGTPWLLAKLGRLAVSVVDVGGRIGRRTGELLMSAPLFGLIASADDSHDAHLRVGRALERMWLTVTAEGLGLQPISELVQVAEIRSMLGETMGVGGLVAQQPFRLGYPRVIETAHTPRRSFDQVVRRTAVR